ncbi:cobyrinate a,c-diamide synthase [Desulfovibrio litoralis]|uniref:Cobyrinic acid a,c-diamide synthase n=1 Tax=Desulfovibrio litoralis DSM 11393 TaxID=1121455 RepID=A0A1M7SZ94_9BACT|nr:cobyrinate a,c-diamide synthase [Desulfovibrio litoralis]SHN63724.1 cobyrinic acid a,c-diamide synthase [Desulfovibrio litoralis DSM 11393]
MKKIVISALSGSTGKTFVTLGLMRAFTRRGLKVRAFKKGPDYIDTAWHSLATRLTACNLDPFFMSPQQIKELFIKRMLFNYSGEEDFEKPCDLAIIEGNRGLFDGLDTEGSCSTAYLAKTLQAPVILLINVTKMTRTIAAIVNGCETFDPELNIVGIIANKTGSQRHGKLLNDCVKKYCKTEFLGFLPRLVANPILERDTGLIELAEMEKIDKTLDELADFVEAHLNLDQILELASVENDESEQITTKILTNQLKNHIKPFSPSINIGYIQDNFLGHLYPENLEALKETGAKLSKLTLNNTNNWNNINGLYIPSGSVEAFIDSLNNLLQTPNGINFWNEIMNVLKDLSNKNIPIYTEGIAGWLLAEKLIIKDKTYAMSGVFPLTAHHNHKKRGLGYVVATTKQSPFFDNNTKVLGHEFNYTNWTLNKQTLVNHAFELSKGSGLYKNDNSLVIDGLFINNTQLNSTQIHSFANIQWAEHFVNLAKSNFK